MKWLLLSLFLALPAYAEMKLAITVDDLPEHGNLPPGVTREQIATKMAAVFQKHKVPEVYDFINAGKANTEAVLKIWRSAGFLLGNHTYLHEDLHKTSLEKFTQSISRNEAMLEKMSGGHDWHYFRFPFLREGNDLDKRNGVRKFLRDAGYKIAQVTIDFEDWSWNNPYVRCLAKGDNKSIAWLSETYLKNAEDQMDRAKIVGHALFQREIPQILLLHIGAFDTEKLDELLTRFEAKGVEFISLAEAAKDPMYDFNPRVLGPRGLEFTYQVMKARGLKLKDVGLKPYDGYSLKKLEATCL